MHGWRVLLPDPCNCRGEQADVSTQTTLRVGGNSHARMNVIVRETRVKRTLRGEHTRSLLHIDISETYFACSRKKSPSENLSASSFFCLLFIL